MVQEDPPSSKSDLHLAKAKPIINSGITSAITYLRREEPVRCVLLFRREVGRERDNYVETVGFFFTIDTPWRCSGLGFGAFFCSRRREAVPYLFECKRRLAAFILPWLGSGRKGSGTGSCNYHCEMHPLTLILLPPLAQAVPINGSLCK